MGACVSTAEDTATPMAAPRTNNQRKGRGEPDRINSLVRVGSKVLKTTPNQGGTGTHLSAARASTYDHVHVAVLTSFDSIDVQKRKAGITGLQNLGNTCFMNSSLQCLSNTIPLLDYFLGYDYRKEINYSNFLGTKGQLVTSYTTLMKKMWLAGDRVDPSSFKRTLCGFAPQFDGGAQHDSQELLAFLLDGLHEDLNRVKDRPYIEDKDCDGTNDDGDAVLAWQNYLLRNRSIVVDLFQGQLRNTMTCRNRNKRQPNGSAGCGHKNIKFEPFMYLSLPLSHTSTSLDDCLDMFCEEEHLTGDNQWYCTKCGTHVDATKKFDLWMLPPILIVHLKRFDARGNKIEKPISYDIENWNLSHVVKSKTGLSPVFDLYAVSNHAGNLGGGHYTAMVKNRFDETWYEMNDSKTRRIGANELERNPKAYCLFYNRVETTNANGSTELRRRDPKVRRQSVDRPENWPHMQLTTDFQDFRRSTVVRGMKKMDS